jgi:hypothetical protein
LFLKALGQLEIAEIRGGKQLENNRIRGGAADSGGNWLDAIGGGPLGENRRGRKNPIREGVIMPTNSALNYIWGGYTCKV